MSINYGRSLPKSPRPKPPQPKLGEVGMLRGLGRSQRRRRKPQEATAPPIASNDGSKATAAKSQTPDVAKKKKKKRKQERPKQNTPVRVEVVKPAPPPLKNATAQSTRVVVEWRRAERRYLAWGKRGIKAVDGWRECSEDSAYRRLLENLDPIGIKLSITDQQIPVAQILDLIIATGKVLKPRKSVSSGGSPAGPSSPPRQAQRRSRRGQQQIQTTRPTRRRRSADLEAARNEVLVIRPGQAKSSSAERRQSASTRASNKERKRRELLAQQQKELSRLSWLRRNGYEDRDTPDDMMHVALQGGSPGLKR